MDFDNRRLSCGIKRASSERYRRGGELSVREVAVLRLAYAPRCRRWPVTTFMTLILF